MLRGRRVVWPEITTDQPAGQAIPGNSGGSAERQEHTRPAERAVWREAAMAAGVDVEYNVERIPGPLDAGEARLQEVIDRAALDGWTLKQVVPAGGGLLVVFERCLPAIAILVQSLLPDLWRLGEVLAEDLAEEGHECSLEEDTAGRLVAGGADMVVHVVGTELLGTVVDKLLDRAPLTETAKRRTRRLVEQFRAGEKIEEAVPPPGQHTAAIFVNARFALSVPLHE